MSGMREGAIVFFAKSAHVCMCVCMCTCRTSLFMFFFCVSQHLNLQDVPEMLVREIVQLGLKASRQRGDPSLGLGFTLPDAKGLRNAAGRRVHLGTAPAAVEGAEVPGEASDDGGHLSPEEALFARVQAEVIKDDKVAASAAGGVLD